MGWEQWEKRQSAENRDSNVRIKGVSKENDVWNRINQIKKLFLS